MTDISQHFNSLSQAIQFAHESHRVTGQNLANVNTPGYQTQEMSFQQFLTTIESRDTNMEDVRSLAVHNVQGLVDRADGNNVDLDSELANLKKNSLAYQTLTQLLGSKMGIMQRAMTG